MRLRSDTYLTILTRHAKKADNVALLQPAASLTLHTTKEISHSMVTMVGIQLLNNGRFTLRQVTFSCPMSFEAYPFDTQVALF